MSASKTNPPASSVMVKTKTPGIFKRGNRYIVVTRYRGKQVKTSHRTMEEARAAKGDRTGSDRPAPQSTAPFDTYATAWIESYQGRTTRGLDEDTRAAYKRALELHAIPHFRNTKLRDITRADINALIGKLQKKGLAPASVSRYMLPVQALFADALDNHDVTANPTARLRVNAKARDNARPKAAHIKALTPAESRAVLSEVPDEHRLVFDVLAGTGCRISEALGLDWGDLVSNGDHTMLRIERQFYRGKLKRNTKTEAGARTIELSPDLAAKLWQAGADSTGPMFTTFTGEYVADAHLRRVLAKAAKRAGVPDVTPHTLRHTHGSMLLDAGWTIPEVSERLGHANALITAQVYSHKRPDRRRDLTFLDEPQPSEVAA